ncbi:MAG: succinate-semialdehyde dehydrogenase [Acidithiobacillales bacterium SG8_45]|jgi:succinate-semialdehyde dehydrogenase/glutarate-semialdehyde dehydrogenase|nr:MAG: succinate-semialdehyde dehydrogenase [Acidithiobacillales bacterium SG8_45]
MAMETLNPATGALVKSFDTWGNDELEAALQQVAAATPGWRDLTFGDRAVLMHNAAKVLREKSEHYASLITLEMGKPIKEARGEIEKCAWVCDYYAEHAETFLADEAIETDADKSYVAYLPLGTVLAVMPWNFPFWQVFRFAAPGLMAGNTGVLKHASNVPQCALAIEEVFREAGFPTGSFRTLMISAAQVKGVIEDARVHAVTLTGSEPAGRQVASTAGNAIKKSVLELGGSDAFVVLEDADLDTAASVGVTSRFLNNGQSCIAAKRFIVVDAIADEFVRCFREKIEKLNVGDPSLDETDVGPMSRQDLRDELHKQVQDSIAQGAVAELGCEPMEGPGAYYRPSILDKVVPGIRAYEEELFGPVAIIIRARDEDDAQRIANDSRFGLGGSVWTQDSARGERFALRMQSGATFVNGLVKSDPRLPFGGTKASGYGRELSTHGIREFVNAKTIWIS